MILDILEEGDPFLKNVIPAFNSTDRLLISGLAQDLVETMRHHDAFGLAAIQCALPYRVFVMFNTTGGPERVCFNPEILNHIGEPELGVEGCLSFPRLELKVKRAPVIQVRYMDAHGKTGTETLEGLQARCFQHELDHLDGITFDERVGSFSLKRAKERRKKLA